MNNLSPTDIIYKGKLHFETESHVSLEKLLNFRWREQDTISSHVDRLLEWLLNNGSPKDLNKVSIGRRGLTGREKRRLVKLMGSVEFRQLTPQAEHSGWKSLINQIKDNLNLSE